MSENCRHDVSGSIPLSLPKSQLLAVARSNKDRARTRKINMDLLVIRAILANCCICGNEKEMEDMGKWLVQGLEE